MSSNLILEVSEEEEGRRIEAGSLKVLIFSISTALSAVWWVGCPKFRNLVWSSDTYLSI